MLIAFGAFALAALLTVTIERRLLAWSGTTPVTEWFAQHVYSPLLRVFVVLVFVFAAYPELFGLARAPALHSLFAGGSNRFDALVNWLLLVSLVLPLAPFAERLPGLVLPIQGVIASCVLFNWLAAALGVEASLWMGWRIAAEVLAIGIGASLAARWLADERHSTSVRTLGEPLLLVAQLPAIMIYARALGRQIA